MAGNRFRLKLRRRPAVAQIEDLVVSPSFNGSAGSGWSQATPRPTATTRTEKPQPWCVIAFVERERFTGDLIVGVQAGAKGGLSEVVALMEGGVARAIGKTKHHYLDPNGVPRMDYLHHFRIKHATALAQSGGVLGRCELFFKAIALDKPTFEDRIVGPYKMYPALEAFDAVLEVGAGQAYPTMDAALTHARAHPELSCDIVNKNLEWITAPRPSAANCSFNTEFWTRIRSETPCTLGNSNGYEVQAWNGSKFTAQKWGLNQVWFQGENIKWSQSNMSALMSGCWQMEGGGDWLRRDAIEITQGTPIVSEFSRFVSGSGHEALVDGFQGGSPYYYVRAPGGPNIFDTFLWIHDVSERAVESARLVKHCKIERCTGTAIQSLGWRLSALGPLMDACVHGCEISDIGGWFNGLCWYNPGLELTYDGPAAWVGFEKTCANGQVNYTCTLLSAGAGYTPGSYNRLSISGGAGSNGKVSVVVAADGTVASVRMGPLPPAGPISSDFGSGYLPGDIVTVSGIGPGTGFTFRLNGNFLLYEGSDSASAVVTYEFMIAAKQRVQELVTDINTHAPTGWSAINKVVDREISASYLSYESAVAISQPIPKTALSGTSNPKTAHLRPRIDVHANVFATPSTGAINLSYFGIQAYNIVGASPGSMGSSMKDVGLQCSSWHTIEHAIPPANGGPGQQSGYWNAGQNHVVTQNITMQGGGVFSSGQPRAHCVIENSYFNNLGAHAANSGLEIRNCVLRQSPKPAAADGTTILLVNKGDTDIFVNPAYPNRDLRPKPLGGNEFNLKLANGKIAGLYDRSGEVQLI